LRKKIWKYVLVILFISNIQKQICQKWLMMYGVVWKRRVGVLIARNVKFYLT
jgi:hypothetical protein